MNVSVFGLGYVGCVTAGCLAKDGHVVIGVDVQESKVQHLSSGQPTVIESGLDDLIHEGFSAGRITATTDAEVAIASSDASIVCVGTPNASDGSLDLNAIRSTVQAIGQAIGKKLTRHLVIIRSTVPSGTAEDIVLPDLLSQSGKSVGEIGLVVVPEFLREGCAIADYYDPPFVVVGCQDGNPGNFAEAINTLFGTVVGGQVRYLPFREAEMLKALCNVFHALKVAFANEVGTLCSSLSIDGRAVMGELVSDRKLNISPAYLRPGMPFGGSCLPKDLRMILNLAHKSHIDLPVLRGVLTSNDCQVARAVAAIKSTGARKIGLDGLAFKAGTDDLRESPQVLIAEHLIGKGLDLAIFDPAVEIACLTGSNRKFIEEHLPHLSSRLVSTPQELVEHADLLVLTREKSAVRDVIATGLHSIRVIDLVGNDLSIQEPPSRPFNRRPSSMPIL